MRKQKILIVLFAGSLVLPGVVWAGFSGRFDTENNENRKLAEFPEVNLESLGAVSYTHLTLPTKRIV